MTKILKKLGLSKDISNTTQMLDALDITLQSVDITNAVRITEMRKANPSEPLVIKTNTKFIILLLPIIQRYLVISKNHKILIIISKFTRMYYNWLRCLPGHSYIYYILYIIHNCIKHERP